MRVPWTLLIEAVLSSHVYRWLIVSAFASQCPMHEFGAIKVFPVGLDCELISCRVGRVPTCRGWGVHQLAVTDTDRYSPHSYRARRAPLHPSLQSWQINEKYLSRHERLSIFSHFWVSLICRLVTLVWYWLDMCTLMYVFSVGSAVECESGPVCLTR